MFHKYLAKTQVYKNSTSNFFSLDVRWWKGLLFLLGSAFIHKWTNFELLQNRKIWLWILTCSRHQSLQIFEFQFSNSPNLCFYLLKGDKKTFFIGPKNIFDQRKMFSCPASINKNKDLENWISNIWRLWCREQVNTVQNPVKRSDIIICFRIRLINFTKLSSNKIFRNEMLTVF